MEEKYNNEFLLCRLKNGNSDGVIKKEIVEEPYHRLGYLN